MIKFEVECEIPRLRFAYVYCPNCNSKFDAMSHGRTEEDSILCDKIDLRFGKFKCPECGEKFQTRDQDIEFYEK